MREISLRELRLSLQNRQIEIPDSFYPLFLPKRYKVFYGGRGGAKSHNFARALLVKGMGQKLRILCARELQKSVKDSVHRLLSDLISLYRLEDFYKVQKQEIIGINGTEFIFMGLKHNYTEVKSTEGVDIAWIEEAEKVSHASWEVLIPTIRKDNSEIWCSFNPKYPTDPTYIRMVDQQDENMLVRKVSYKDNPYFPDVLEQERIKLQQKDPLAYAHIWEGEFDKRFSGHIFAQKMDAAREAGRITNVPHKPGSLVWTAWDLGKRNNTSIWFCQVIGFQPRIIDHYSCYGQDLDPIIERVKEKPYDYGMHFLPHDSKHERLGMDGSIKKQLQDAGLKCDDIPLGSIEGRNKQANKFIDMCWFDKDNCIDGINSLMHYKYEYNEDKKRFSDTPLKDDTTDDADAFGYLSQAYELGLMDVISEDDTETTLYSGAVPPAQGFRG